MCMPYSRKARYLLSIGLLLVALATGSRNYIHSTQLLTQNWIEALRDFVMGMGITFEFAGLWLMRRERLSGGRGTRSSAA